MGQAWTFGYESQNGLWLWIKNNAPQPDLPKNGDCPLKYNVYVNRALLKTGVFQW